MKQVIIDVRELDEFNAESIADSVHVPLSNFNSVAPGVLGHFLDRKVVIMCRSGARAKMALDQAKRLGFQPDGGYEVYPGGILNWKKQGQPTIARKSKHLPILRQTHLIAGGLGLTGVLLGYFAHPGFYALAGFVTAGLTFAGASGICLMSNILALAPWNKNLPTLKDEVCLASTGQTVCE